MNPFRELLALVHRGHRPACRRAGTLPAGLDLDRVAVEPPRDAAHGEAATNAALVLAKAARQAADGAGRPAGRGAGGPRRDRRAPSAAPPGSSTSPCARLLAAAGAAVLAAGADYGRSDARRAAAGQCRVLLGQPDRAAACRPWPRHRVRRRAGQRAGPCRLRRHPRILCQRRRRADRDARPLRCTCATARRWARPIGEIPPGLYPATI